MYVRRSPAETNVQFQPVYRGSLCFHLPTGDIRFQRTKCSPSLLVHAYCSLFNTIKHCSTDASRSRAEGAVNDIKGNNNKQHGGDTCCPPPEGKPRFLPGRHHRPAEQCLDTPQAFRHWMGRSYNEWDSSRQSPQAGLQSVARTQFYPSTSRGLPHTRSETPCGREQKIMSPLSLRRERWEAIGASP